MASQTCNLTLFKVSSRGVGASCSIFAGGFLEDSMLCLQLLWIVIEMLAQSFLDDIIDRQGVCRQVFIPKCKGRNKFR
jgi:hypothetical protein